MTLLELLLALAIGGLLMGLVLPLTLSHRDLVRFDQTRTGVNQTLRGAMDLVGTDIRIAGERLSPRYGNLPVLEMQGSDLVLRRNLLHEVGVLCQDLQANRRAVFLALKSAQAPEGCRAPRESAPPRRWLEPPTLGAWRDYRAAHGGTVTAFIYNSKTEQGEFFSYSEEQENGSGFAVLKADAAPWSRAYPALVSRLYLLEEHRYRLRDGVLEVVVNRDERSIQTVVAGLSRFTVRALTKGGAVITTFDAAAWRDVGALEVTLSATARSQRGDVERSLTSRFFPRNALSD